MKQGIHSNDWNELLETIRREIPEPYASQVIRILEELATHK